MSWRPRLGLPLWAVVVALCLGGAWSGWLGARHLAGKGGALDRAEATFADLRTVVTGRRASPADVAIVAIDEPTVAAEGGYPIDRGRLAELVAAIGAAGARTVAVDLLFLDPTNERSDAALASALGALPAVIAAAGRFGDARASRVPAPREEVRPLARFAEAAAVGFVNVATDAGGTPRHVPLVYRTPGGVTPSLALRAASLFVGSDAVLTADGVRVGGAFRPTDVGWHLPLRYLGPEGTVDTVAADAVLAQAPGVAPVLEGRLVVVGATATGIGDRFATPFDPVLPGVEVLATAIAHLLDGSGLVRDGAVRRLDVAAALTLTALGVVAVSVLPPVPGLVVFALFVLGWLAAATLAFAQNYWLSMTLPLAGPVPAVAAAAAVREVLDRRRARAVSRSAEALRRFQAPVLAARLAEDPDFLREPVEQTAAILFVDLSGFTRLSEGVGPARTRGLLKDFHTLVVEEAQRRGGVVMAFMGDGAMIVFGIPEPAAGDAARALEAGHALLDAGRAWLAEAGVATEIPGLRVGAHVGPVVASRLGHDRHQHITAAGDSVNVASRLMEVARANGAVLAASSALVEAAGDAAPGGYRVENVAIRGRRERMTVFLWDGAGA